MSQHEMTDAAEIREALMAGGEWTWHHENGGYATHNERKLEVYVDRQVMSAGDEDAWAYRLTEDGVEGSGGVDDVMDLPRLVSYADPR